MDGSLGSGSVAGSHWHTLERGGENAWMSRWFSGRISLRGHWGEEESMNENQSPGRGVRISYGDSGAERSMKG